MYLHFFSVFVWAGVIELGVVPHANQGFFCGDQSISLKYTGETIHMKYVLVSMLVPFFIMWMSEAMFYKPSSIKSTRFRKSLCQSFFWFREYLIGIVIHLFLVETIKVDLIIIVRKTKYVVKEIFLCQLFVGELRPHFLDSCKPDKAINCTVG